MRAHNSFNIISIISALWLWLGKCLDASWCDILCIYLNSFCQPAGWLAGWLACWLGRGRGVGCHTHTHDTNVEHWGAHQVKYRLASELPLMKWGAEGMARTYCDYPIEPGSAHRSCLFILLNLFLITDRFGPDISENVYLHDVRALSENLYNHTPAIICSQYCQLGMNVMFVGSRYCCCISKPAGPAATHIYRLGLL